MKIEKEYIEIAKKRAKSLTNRLLKYLIKESDRIYKSDNEYQTIIFSHIKLINYKLVPRKLYYGDIDLEKYFFSLACPHGFPFCVFLQKY